MRLRHSARTALAVVVLSVVACASPKVTTIEAFVTRDGRLVAQPLEIPPGETIVRIQNDQAERQRPVLVRTDDPSRPLPVVAGIVPMGAEADVEYTGNGYELVTKLEAMKAFFAGEEIVSRIHAYLEPGTYELFSNLRGHYEAGKRLRIVVVER